MARADLPHIDCRRVALEDFPMLGRWLAEQHVREYYQKTAVSPEDVAAKHGPRVRGEVPTISHIALYRDEPFAYLQCYRNADWPD